MNTNVAIKAYHYSKFIDAANDDKLLFRVCGEVSELGVENDADKSYEHMGVNQYYKIGSKVMMKKNIWKKAGIFNGSIGFVEDVILDENL